MSILQEESREAVSENGLWRSRFDNAVYLCEAVSSCTSPVSQIQILNKTLKKILNSDYVFMYLTDASGSRLTEISTIAAIGLISQEQLTSIPTTMGRIQLILDKGQPIVTDCVHPHEADEVPSCMDLQFHCSEMLSVPFIAGDEVLGLFCAFYGKRQGWGEADIGYAVGLGRIAGSLLSGAPKSVASLQGYPPNFENTEKRPPIIETNASNSDRNVRGCGSSFARSALSPREEEVAFLVAKGLSNEEIAKSLYLSLGTVKKAVSNIMRKLDLDNRVKIANYILR